MSLLGHSARTLTAQRVVRKPVRFRPCIDANSASGTSDNNVRPVTGVGLVRTARGIVSDGQQGNDTRGQSRRSPARSYNTLSSSSTNIASTARKAKNSSAEMTTSAKTTRRPAGVIGCQIRFMYQRHGE